MTDEMRESLNKTIKIIIYGVIIMVVLFVLNNLLSKKSITFKTEDGKYSLVTNLDYTGVKPKGYLNKNAEIEFVSKKKDKFGYLDLSLKSSVDKELIKNLEDYSGWIISEIAMNSNQDIRIAMEVTKILNSDILVAKYDVKENEKDYFIRVYIFETDTDYASMSLTGLKKDEEKTTKEFDKIVSSLEMSD